MDSGAADHVMPEEMFPSVKVQRNSAPKRFVAAKGKHIRNMGEKTIPFKTSEGIHRCITFRSASVVKPLIPIRKVVQRGQRCGDGRKEFTHSKHSRWHNNQAGTTVCIQWTCWVCLDETGSFFQLAGTVTRSKAVSELVRPVALCNSEDTQHEIVIETEVNGVGGEDHEMRDGAGDGTTRLASERWSEKQTHPYRDWCAHCMMGRGRPHHHLAK